MYPFWIFQILPSIYKKHNSQYITPIDATFIFFDSLKILILSLKIGELKGLYFWSYEFLKWRTLSI